MTKKQAIKEINEFPSRHLNQDQKRVAIGIIKNLSEGESVLNYFDFVTKRCDVGFSFDASPEIVNGRLAVVKEMPQLNLNVINNQVKKEENKLIIGDNYEALKNLLLTHREKINVIYIDPPYNTEAAKIDGNDSSKTNLGGGGHIIQDFNIKINLAEMVDWIWWMNVFFWLKNSLLLME